MRVLHEKPVCFVDKRAKLSNRLGEIHFILVRNERFTHEVCSRDC